MPHPGKGPGTAPERSSGRGVWISYSARLTRAQAPVWATSRGVVAAGFADSQARKADVQSLHKSTLFCRIRIGPQRMSNFVRSRITSTEQRSQVIVRVVAMFGISSHNRIWDGLGEPSSRPLSSRVEQCLGSDALHEKVGGKHGQ